MSALRVPQEGAKKNWLPPEQWKQQQRQFYKEQIKMEQKAKDLKNQNLMTQFIKKGSNTTE
jgi:hypothetical protein